MTIYQRGRISEKSLAGLCRGVGNDGRYRDEIATGCEDDDIVRNATGDLNTTGSIKSLADDRSKKDVPALREAIMKARNKIKPSVDLQYVGVV